MIPNLPRYGILALIVATAGAQVASHAPTTPTAPAGSAATAPITADRTVATVNGTVLTGADLLREEYAIFPYARQHNGVPKELAAQIRDGAMKMLVFEELSYQEALRRHMTISPAKLQSAEAQFRKQFPAPDQYKAFVDSEFHGSRRLLDEKIRRSLLIEALLKVEVENKCTITPVELRAAYDKNAARYTHPEMYTFQTISVLPPPNATADQLKEGRKRADQAIRQAKQTKSAEEFGMLAEKISDDDYRVVMGQHKPVPVTELAQQVVKALRAMKPGDVSDLIQLDQAYTIVRLGEHVPAGQTKFEEVKAQLAKEMQQTKRNQLRASLDRQLRQKAKIEEF
ncbi:MAG TPA: peptidyl-prolyl cis-trans isomerase [Acidobacteriaceae bacterium]|nr:peptidyl-prolyl cis-trans isomerase [Acidobacteriaceae bacterium]